MILITQDFTDGTWNRKETLPSIKLCLKIRELRIYAEYLFENTYKTIFSTVSNSIYVTVRRCSSISDTFHKIFSFCWNLVKIGLIFSYHIQEIFFSDCNQTYTENYGRISSPKWPNRAPPNIVCEFVINVPSSRTITVYPRIFRLRTHSNCTHAYLEVCTYRIVSEISSRIFIFLINF